MTRILFVDLDDTIRKGPSALGRYVNTPGDVEIFPEVIPLLGWWKSERGPIIGITNQGGVGLGYMSEDTHLEICKETMRQTGNLLDTISACTHRPDAECNCRKPKTGLIDANTKALRLSDSERIQCLMIGDLLSDKACAENAGLPFQWADMWRRDGFIQ